MKIQYLAVIFLIIIMPIVMVLSQYIDYHIDAVNLKHTYNTKLLEATYDSIKAYQLNTVNNAISDISAAKIEDLEAAVKTFFNSLSTNFNYSGYNSGIMNDYVPAVVFSMYDGYYIYSPYRNVLTGVSTDVDEDYANNEILNGIKSYVYYSCRYKKDTGSNKFDVVITYTLDNYITIQGEVNGNYINEYGYLVDGIEEIPTSYYEDGKQIFNYKYDGITFKYNDDTELLKEYLGDKNYPYVKINGTKYYWDEKSGLNNDEIFYINATGERAVQAREKDNNGTFTEYKNFIKQNNSAYRYYRDAYKFTKFVHEVFGNLTVGQAVDWGEDGNSKSLIDILGDQENYFSSEPIFGDAEGTTAIQDSDSNFNAHRSAIIRYTIEKNLETAITGFRNYSKAEDAEYIMPEISDIDWVTIQNNVSIITFLQGFNIAGRDYNEYCVVANNLTKEYVDENDIYLLGKDGMYYKPNDTSLTQDNVLNWNNVTNTWDGYAAGIWKINFERKNYRYAANDSDNYQNYYYYPIRYGSSSNNYAYLGSYSSIVNSTSIDNTNVDLYKYMRATEEDGTTKKVVNSIRTTYYTALARERWGQYSVNNDIDIVQGNIVNTETLDEIDMVYPEVQIGVKTKDNQPYNNQWTKQNVILTGTATENIKIKSFGFEPDIDEMDLAPSNNDKNVIAEIELNKTGKHTYYFWAKDSSDNYSDTNEKTVYIDKDNPGIEVKGSEESGWINGDTNINIEISDKDSGINKYTIIRGDGTQHTETNLEENKKEIPLTVTEDGEEIIQIYVEDKAGNANTDNIKIKIDKTAPAIKVEPESSEVSRNKEIKITLTDELSGLESEQGICYLSSSDKENERQKNYQYTSGQPFTIGEGLTGTYYLWVGGDVYDNAGNKADERLIGQFTFDNKAPEVKLEVEDNGENEVASLTEKITITLTDDLSGLATDTGKCYLSTSEEENTKTKEYSFTSRVNLEVGEGLTGTYYIWIDHVADKLGNTTGIKKYRRSDTKI